MWSPVLCLILISLVTSTLLFLFFLTKCSSLYSMVHVCALIYDYKCGLSVLVNQTTHCDNHCWIHQNRADGVFTHLRPAFNPCMLSNGNDEIL